MLENFAIGLALTALLLVGEYCWFRQRNRQRSVWILDWIKHAFSEHGSVGSIRWNTASCFHVELKLCSSVFRRMSLVVRLQPCDLLGRLLYRTNQTQETVTFEAELDAHNNSNVYVQKHLWRARTCRVRPKSLDGWSLHSLDPMVLSTRAEHQNGRGNVLDILLAARCSKFLRVAFRRHPPRFVACAPLQSLSPDEQDAELFTMLEELASRASTSTH